MASCASMHEIHIKAHDPLDATTQRTLPSVTTLMLLIGIGGVVVYVSPHDPWSLVLTIGSFVILTLLYHCLHLFEITPPDSPRRERLKIAVWLLSTLLTLVFTSRVASVMPLVPAVVIWAMAGTSMFAGFYLLFVYDDGRRDQDQDHLGVDDLEKPLKEAC